MTAWLEEDGGVDARCAELESMTLLMAATGGGQEAIVRLLLQRGASVDLQTSLGGTTALMHAAIKDHTTIVQALLDAQADTSLLSMAGKTALMIAEQVEHTAVAQLLRKHAMSQAPGRPHDLHPVGGTLSGRRVRIARAQRAVRHGGLLRRGQGAVCSDGGGRGGGRAAEAGEPAGDPRTCSISHNPNP